MLHSKEDDSSTQLLYTHAWIGLYAAQWDPLLDECLDYI